MIYKSLCKWYTLLFEAIIVSSFHTTNLILTINILIHERVVLSSVRLPVYSPVHHLHLSQGIQRTSFSSFILFSVLTFLIFSSLTLSPPVMTFSLSVCELNKILCYNNNRIWGEDLAQGKMHLSPPPLPPPVALAAVCSEVVLLLLLIYCLMYFSLFVLCLSLFCYALLCVLSVLVLQSS